MDAVILANYFHQHAPFAIKALKAGLHVMSECTSCKTLAEGAALCREVEKSGKIYMLAENYPYTAPNQEMRKLYVAGEIGRVLYGEGEYNHPMSLDDLLRISPGLDHWRNNIPSAYYCTHALAPLMAITDTMPVSVNALSIAEPERMKATVRRGDRGSVILCRMDNGAVFRLFGVGIPGHSIWYRLHGTRGSMEHVRGPGYWGPGQLRIIHEEWDREPNEPGERTYVPDFPELSEKAARTGHGGSDFFTNHYFAEAIRANKQPYLDVYRGVSMSAVGIQAWKSALEDGKPYKIPDFRNESEREACQDDRWSPFPEDAGPGQPPPSIAGHARPTKRAIDHARSIWRDVGYED
jgi:predicted dehydrogenase